MLDQIHIFIALVLAPLVSLCAYAITIRYVATGRWLQQALVLMVAIGILISAPFIWEMIHQ